MADWDAAVIARLRELWDEGLSAAAIGRAIHMSKNAVVGKAHRLNLPSRPSPIRRRGAPAPVVRRAPRETLAPLSTVSVPLMEKPVRIQMPGNAPCCWPVGEPRSPSFHFCNARALRGKVYCDDHAAMAFVRVRVRRAERACDDVP